MRRYAVWLVGVVAMGWSPVSCVLPGTADAGWCGLGVRRSSDTA